MTKQQLSVQSPRHLPFAGKRPIPVPGERLGRAVDTVLARLGAERAEAECAEGTELARLDDVLRTALAWTAAAGDTCRIAPVVEQVRDARAGLANADTEYARSALVAARDNLHLVPNQRMH